MTRALELELRDVRSRPKIVTIFRGPRPVTAFLNLSFCLCSKRDLRVRDILSILPIPTFVQ